MILTRDLSSLIIELAKSYPAITLTGPRQSGKTTLLKSLFPDKPYFNLEDPELRLKFSDDPKSILKDLPDGAIFDEFQRVPNLPSYLQVIIDESQEPGKFFLSGSQQLEVMSKITQSLAGRTAVLKLLPFSIHELKENYLEKDLDHLLLKGFYPRIYDKNLNPEIMYKNYFETYIQRDLHQIIHLQYLDSFQRFVQLCAGRIGNIFIASQLANEIGVSVATIQSWLSILQASYIVYLLPPYFENFNKRITKAPKLYFYDVGLAAYLLRIRTSDQMARDPLKGALFENLVVMELLKSRFNQGREPDLYYFRDQNQQEVDLVFKLAHELIPIEIKSSSTFNPNLIKGLTYFQKLVGNRINKSYLIYSGTEEFSFKEILFKNYFNLHHLLV